MLEYFYILPLKSESFFWTKGSVCTQMQVWLSSELSKHVFLPRAKTVSNIPFKHCDQTDKVFKFLCYLNEAKLFLEKPKSIKMPLAHFFPGKEN